MDVDPHTQMLGAWIRTIFTLAALFAVIDFMVMPMIGDWYRQRQRERQRERERDGRAAQCRSPVAVGTTAAGRSKKSVHATLAGMHQEDATSCGLTRAMFVEPFCEPGQESRVEATYEEGAFPENVALFTPTRLYVPSTVAHGLRVSAVQIGEHVTRLRSGDGVPATAFAEDVLDLYKDLPLLGHPRDVPDWKPRQTLAVFIVNETAEKRLFYARLQGWWHADGCGHATQRHAE